MNYRPQATPSKPGPCYRTGRPERWAAGPRVSQESCTSRPPRLCECALAVRIHAARQNSQRLPATGLRPATVATLSRLASSRLVSSRLVSCHTTLRPYDPRVLPSSVPSCPNDPRVLSSSVTSFDPRISPHPRLVCLAPSQHRVFSVLCSLISSRSKPRLSDRGQQCGPLHSREQPRPPLIVLRNDPRDRPQRCRPQRQNSCTAVETRSVLGLRRGAPLELRPRPERIRAAHSAAARHMASYAEA